MNVRNSTPSSVKIISNLELAVESLISEIQQINASPLDIRDSDAIESLEIKVYAKMTTAADSASA